MLVLLEHFVFILYHIVFILYVEKLIRKRSTVVCWTYKSDVYSAGRLYDAKLIINVAFYETFQEIIKMSSDSAFFSVPYIGITIQVLTEWIVRRIIAAVRCEHSVYSIITSNLQKRLSNTHSSRTLSERFKAYRNLGYSLDITVEYMFDIYIDRKLKFKFRSKSSEIPGILITKASMLSAPVYIVIPFFAISFRAWWFTTMSRWSYSQSIYDQIYNKTSSMHSKSAPMNDKISAIL